MTIIDPDLLREFSTPGRCEVCGAWCQTREGHHIIARGMGGGRRLDLPCNLVALGQEFCCPCHGEIHNGRFLGQPMSPPAIQDRLFAIASRRELYRILQLPKGSVAV